MAVREGSTEEYKNGEARHNIPKYWKGKNQSEHAESEWSFMWTSKWLSCCRDYKQLLDEVFVISRIKQKLNLITVLYIERKKKWKSYFCFFTDGKRHKTRELDMNTRDLECPWHDYCIICYHLVTGAEVENSLYAFRAYQKRVRECNV